MSDKETPDLTDTEKALIEAFRKGDSAKIAELTRKPDEPKAEPTPKEVEAAKHTAWIHASYEYRIPVAERLALWVVARMVMQGHFTRDLLNSGEMGALVKDLAEYMREGILATIETPETFFRELRQYGKGE